MSEATKKQRCSTNVETSLDTRAKAPVVAAAFLGVVTMTTAACDSGADEITARAFTSIGECVESGDFTRDECETSHNDALAAHKEAAPRYDSKAACEEEFGEGKCEAAPTYSTSTGTVSGNDSGNSFMPFFMGYMLGGGGSTHHYHGAAPVYKTRSNSWFTSGGHPVASTAFSRAGTTLPKATVTSPLRSGGAYTAPSTTTSGTRSGGFGTVGRGMSGGGGGMGG